MKKLQKKLSECCISEFFENPDYASVFSGSLEIYNIIMMLSTLLGNSAVFVEGETVLILDEIQECPEARTALKFFKWRVVLM